MKINPNLIENKITDVFKLKRYSKSVTIGANAFTNINMGSSADITGYTRVGVIGRENGYGDQWLVSYTIYSNNQVQAMVHSKYTSSLTASLVCYVVYMKTDVYNSILVS